MKKAKAKRRCCPCKGAKAPSFQCKCHCHEGEGTQVWEEIAFTWIFDADTPEERDELWRRFLDAYPGITAEPAEQFLERFKRSHWWRKHHHKFDHHHHHHHYC